MPCDIKLQVQVFDEQGNLTTKAKTIKKGVDELEELSYQSLVDYIIQLPKNKRNELAAQLRAAKTQTLTESDLKKHRFISNTTIDEIFNKYPELKEAYPDLQVNPSDNYTIIACNKLKINGHTYYGRVTDSKGNEMFVLNGKYGAEHLIKYLDIKGKIKDSFDGKKLKEPFSKYQKNLDLLSKKFGKSGEELLIEFINDKTHYKTYKEGDKVVVPQKILNELLYDISGNYNPDNGKTDLQVSLESIKQKTDNNWVWKFQTSQLYDTLSYYYDNIPSKEQFEKMSSEELNQLFSEIFQNDPRMMRARVSNTERGKEREVNTEEKQGKVNQKTIDEVYSTIKKSLKDQGVTLPSLATLIKNSPEQALGLVKDALSSYIDKDGKPFNNLNVIIKEGKIQATYTKPSETITKTSSGHITLTFPWMTLGEVYNFSYSSDYMFSPVKKEGDLVDVLDEDGMYKGSYIYEYYNPKTKTTHYAISRHIISPNANMHTTPTLEAALRHIDHWNNTQKINEWGLWSIKQNKGRPRMAKVESGKLSIGQLLTTINIELPNVNIAKMPQVFRDSFNGVLPEFHKTFGAVENITDLNTPEKAAAFILIFYNQLNTADKQEIANKKANNITDKKELASKKLESLDKLLKDNESLVQQIISDINNSPKVSYIIENIAGNYATLKYASNNGTDIKIGGKFDNNIPANTPTIESMRTAVDYFNKSFGLNIKVLSKAELQELNSSNNLGIENKLDSVRAFVFNGNIYINGSTADTSDLFHEMAHIFLGVLKVKYPDAYTGIISKYAEGKKFAKNFNYINKTYRNLSHQDKIEETVVDMIAQQMFNKNSLVDQFKGQEFVDDFKAIIGKFPKLMQEIQDSGLEFSSFMKRNMSLDTMSQVQKNMRISNLVESFIRDGKIIETNC